MTRTVDVRPKAMADIRRIVKRISDTVSPLSAAKWHDQLLAKILTLTDDATVWPEADEADDLGLGLRCMLYGRGRKTYRVLFTYDNSTVNVLRVRHAAQDAVTEDDL